MSYNLYTGEKKGSLKIVHDFDIHINSNISSLVLFVFVFLISDIESRDNMSDYTDNFIDAAYWHPKCKNFVIFDWEKWDRMNVKVPTVYDPPQRYTMYQGWKSAPMWWWHRSWFCWPLPGCYLSCCSPKPFQAKLTDKNQKVFKDLLRPNFDSSKVPKPLRNSLFWMEDNIAAETLFSFNRWSWRSQSETGRVIGVGHLGKDFTGDVNMYGAAIAKYMDSAYVNAQMSPDGKWLLLTTFKDPHNVDEECQFLFMYVVQPGDVFKTKDGNIIEYVEPGDLIRVTYNISDPYDVSTMKYLYFPRRVATIDEKTRTITMISPHYEDLMRKATANPGIGMCCRTCCYTCYCCASAEKRYDFQVNYATNAQAYAISSTPPFGNAIERLGEDTLLGEEKNDVVTSSKNKSTSWWW